MRDRRPEQNRYKSTIIKKRLGVKASLYTILQILSVTPFEKTPVNQDFFDAQYKPDMDAAGNQLKLFN